MNLPDISNLNYAQLNELRNDIAARMNDMRATGITQLRATIAEQAQLLGVTIEDLLPKRRRKRRKDIDEEPA